MNAVELLQAARKLIDECGWIQKTAGDRAAGFCVVGAINEVVDANRQGLISGAHSKAIDCLHIAIGTWEVSLAYWNDVPERKREEVLATYDDAIARATST